MIGRGRKITTPVECVILDIPDGLCLNLLGLVVEVGRVRIVADRSGLLGALLASLTCGGVAAADTLEEMARLIRAQEESAREGGQPGPQPAPAS
jgi:hypothetical protein